MEFREMEFFSLIREEFSTKNVYIFVEIYPTYVFLYI